MDPFDVEEMTEEEEKEQDEAESVNITLPAADTVKLEDDGGETLPEVKREQQDHAERMWYRAQPSRKRLVTGHPAEVKEEDVKVEPPAEDPRIPWT